MEAIDTNLTIPPEEVFTEYFNLMKGTSESPLLYHRWTLISTVAALLGRDAYMHFGHEPIYPNMFICLIGDAGTRKSAAIGIGRKLLASTGYDKFARERSSKEKFIKDLGDGFSLINTGSPVNTSKVKSSKAIAALEELADPTPSIEEMEPSEAYISAGELEDFLGQGDGAFISLLTTMWDNLPHYSHGKMTAADIFIKEPTVNLIGGATPTTFNTVFPPEVIGQGFMSRMILVNGAGVHDKITIPKRPDPDKVAVLESLMAEIKRYGKGEYTYTPEAYEVFNDVYQGEIDLGDFRLESYINRRHVHFYKLCIVIAALNLTKVIDKGIAVLANTILHYTERDMPNALGEFGKNMKGDTNTRMVQAIKNWHEQVENEGKILTPEKLFIIVQTDYNDMLDFGKSMGKLKSGKKITWSPTSGLIINEDKSKLQVIPHVDFTLMPEHKQRKV